jgi:hypothetical protein
MLPNPEYMQDFAVRYTAAWCSHQPEKVASYYSPNGSLTINGGVPAVGRIAITASAQSFMTAFPDLQVVMDELLMRGDRAEYHWTLIGTNTGGAGSTGNKVRISGFEEWEMGADGLIAASLGHFDAAEYQRQLEQGDS